jgi:hypothetical protein
MDTQKQLNVPLQLTLLYGTLLSIGISYLILDKSDRGISHSGLYHGGSMLTTLGLYHVVYRGQMANHFASLAPAPAPHHAAWDAAADWASFVALSKLFLVLVPAVACSLFLFSALCVRCDNLE